MAVELLIMATTIYAAAIGWRKCKKRKSQKTTKSSTRTARRTNKTGKKRSIKVIWQREVNPDKGAWQDIKPAVAASINLFYTHGVRHVLIKRGKRRLWPRSWWQRYDLHNMIQTRPVHARIRRMIQASADPDELNKGKARVMTEYAMEMAVSEADSIGHVDETLRKLQARKAVISVETEVEGRECEQPTSELPVPGCQCPSCETEYDLIKQAGEGHQRGTYIGHQANR